MKEIKLSQGKVALVDDEDYEYLNQWKWSVSVSSNQPYVVRRGVGTMKIRMHRVIMRTPEGMQCDHINHNVLDNQKHNLRNCTRLENMMNRSPCGQVKYSGVTRRTPNGKYRARIQHLGKLISLGDYVHDWAAAIAYDNAAKRLFGVFANLNFKQ